MKSVQLTTLMSLLFLSSMAQIIVTKSGLHAKAYFGYMTEDRLTYPANLPDNKNFILYSEIDSINGIIDPSIKKYMLEVNSSIKFNENAVNYSNSLTQAPKAKQVKPLTYKNPSVNYKQTAKCLTDAGTAYLIGSGLTLAGSAVVIFMKGDDRFVYGGVLSLSGLVAYFIGHSNLIKAGKSMNEDRTLSLQPSSYGLGLALKF